MVFLSSALRDVVTLWVESVFILDRSEGLAVFAGVSSSVNCRFSVSLAEWALVMFYSALCLVILRLGASRVECSSSSFAPFAFSLRVQLPEWSVQPFVAVPWGEPISVYSHIRVQFPDDSDVCFFDGVNMCGLLEVLFPTLLYALSA